MSHIGYTDCFWTKYRHYREFKHGQPIYRLFQREQPVYQECTIDITDSFGMDNRYNRLFKIRQSVIPIKPIQIYLSV